MQRSAQRKKRVENQRRKDRIIPLFAKIILPLLIIFAIFVFLKATTRVWNNHDKFSLAFREKDESVGVTVLDPATSELTTIKIPGDTEVDVAENYGTLRIKNVWQLGVNEGKTGHLLSETVMKNFLFPVFLWADPRATSLTDGNIIDVVKFVFNPGVTNIAFGDRIQAGLFAIRIQSLNRSEIDLAKSQFVKKQILGDGVTGYIVNRPSLDRLTVYFADNDWASSAPQIKINDETGVFGVSDRVGEILQAMGGKIVTIDRGVNPGNFDCMVVGRKKAAVVKVRNVLNCMPTPGQTNFDLEITIGSQFAKRF